MSLPYRVVLDSNIWVSELLLQSSIGSAFLHAAARVGAMIVVPEVVERETNKILLDLCTNEVSVVGRATRILRQISQQEHLRATVPSSKALSNGIAKRWKQLEGSITRVPFTHEIAQAAMHRIIARTPPSGQNNEQFRDCCIWESALCVATEGPVHIVTRDSAFFENRDRNQGLAKLLLAEVTAKNLSLRVHHSLPDFLTNIGEAHTVPDEKGIASTIEAAVREIASQKAFELTDRPVHLELTSSPRIKSYATPQPSLMAISFEVQYDVHRQPGWRTSAVDRKTIELHLLGTCSYDPKSKSASEISIQEWSSSIPGYRSTTTHYQNEHFKHLTDGEQQFLVD